MKRMPTIWVKLALMLRCIPMISMALAASKATASKEISWLIFFLAKKLPSRFEEVDADQTSVKPMKRPRESAGVDGKAEDAGKKKKLKAEDGKAVSAEVSSVGEKSHEKEKKKKKKKSTEEVVAEEKGHPKKEQKAALAVKIITGGVTIEDHKIGKGVTAKKGDTVKMRYIGKLTNGKEFDKNVGGKPVSSYLLFYRGIASQFL
jgi:FK506-binding nuclear protein